MSNKTFQKRKYTKGYHVQSKAKKSPKVAVAEEHNESLEIEKSEQAASENDQDKLVEQKVIKVEQKEISKLAIKEDKVLEKLNSINHKLFDARENLIEALEEKQEKVKQKFRNSISDIEQKPTDLKGKVTPGSAIGGFASGILGIFFIFGIILGILAIILGLSALKKIKRQPEVYNGKALAIAAVILGIIDVIGALIFIALIL